MKSDIDLQRDVLKELEWEAGIHTAGIGVTVDNGIVTLIGHVESLVEKMAAGRRARRVPGVQAVVNDIEVRVPGNDRQTDSDIARTALAALSWDIQVPHERIKLSVSDGCVTLEGSVCKQYQKLASEEAVRHLTGVRSVNNLIKVAPRATPEAVRASITAALKLSAELDAERIAIEAHEDNVILRGWTHSRSEREEIERAARAAPGVAHVENHIRVSG